MSHNESDRWRDSCIFLLINHCFPFFGSATSESRSLSVHRFVCIKISINAIPQPLMYRFWYFVSSWREILLSHNYMIKRPRRTGITRIPLGGVCPRERHKCSVAATYRQVDIVSIERSICDGPPIVMIFFWEGHLRYNYISLMAVNCVKICTKFFWSLPLMN